MRITTNSYIELARKEPPRIVSTDFSLLNERTTKEKIDEKSYQEHRLIPLKFEKHEVLNVVICGSSRVRGIRPIVG